TGTWADAVFLSPDSAWHLSAPELGHVSFTGTLQPGQSYTQTLTATVPPVTPGQYRVIVRTDIFNQVYEGTGEANNTTASGTTVTVSAESLQLGVALATTLDPGQDRLFQVVVPQNQTLQVSVQSGSSTAANELFIRALAAPTGTVYDAASKAG